MDISVVIVNYKSSQVLRNSLTSLANTKFDGTWEVIVVDNNSNDNGLPAVKKEYTNVTFIDAPDNRGFSAGNNIGIARAQGETILILNPDTEVQPDALQLMYAKLTSDPSIGVVGPKLIYEDGSLQVKVIPKRIPKLRHVFFEWFYIDKLFSKSTYFNDYYGANFDYEMEQGVEQVSGACLFIKRAVIDRIGSMDEKFFLYFEETDWCARVLKAGFRILYIPSAEVLHFEGKSSGNSARAVRAYYESMCYFFLKHYGKGDMALLYLINIAGYLFRLLFSPYYWLDGQREKPRRYWLALLYHLNILNFGRDLGKVS